MITDLGHHCYLIDARMHGEPERLACYLFDTPNRVLVECGPSSSIEHLFEALDEAGVDDVAVLAVTHIHLDHAGGAGHFARKFPGARVAVHRTGAPHLADPARLTASAARIWGEEGSRELWGPIDPVDPGRLQVVDEGDRIALGGGRSIEVMYTPGHARHHVAYAEEQTGALFVGDAAGMAFPHGHGVQPATPPPDFDPDLTVRQLHRMADRRPAFLGFAHFGPHDDPQAALEEAERRVRRWVEWVEADAGAGSEPGAALRARVLAEYRAAGWDPADIDTYDRNTFWPMQEAGIRRWLELRDRDRRP